MHHDAETICQAIQDLTVAACGLGLLGALLGMLVRAV
jgi:hypothetical protein